MPHLLLILLLMVAVATSLSPAKAQAAYTPQSTLPDFTLSLNPSLTNYQYGPGARTNWTLTSVNGFQGDVNMNYFWLNGSSDIYVGLVNPYLSLGGTFTDQIKVFSPPISLGCCGILRVTATSGSLSHSANFTIAVPPGPDFAVAIAPKTLDAPQGTIVTANVTVTNIDRFSGNIFFTSGVSPGNAGAFSVSSTSVNLASGASGTVLLTIDTTTAAQNTYNFTVTAYDLGHSHSVKLTLKVLSSSAGFTITQIPSLVTIRPGSFFAFTANLTSINGFFGNATLTVAPNTPSLMANLTTRMIVLQPNSTIFTGINITASNAIPPGTYSVIVSASCNGIIHSIAITVVLPFPPGFAITLAQSQLRIQPGSSATVTITLSSISHFNGTITVTTQVVSAGPVTNLSSRTVTLTYLASATTITLTVSLPSNAPAGSDYTIIINATDGATTHQASMTVAAEAPSGAQPPPFTVGLNLIYMITGLVAATIGSILAVVVITKHRKATPSKATGAVDSP